MAAVLPAIGAVIGDKYRVLRVLGQGGMGAVFEAENVLTHKRVALKWLKTHDGDASARLLREAQAAARVRHPNVVDVYDVAREGEAVFLVMEYLAGEPLSALLERKSTPLHQLVALLLPAMRGAAAAHKQGVVHRDIKPDNIFLARVEDAVEPVPKLLDFGISKLLVRDELQLSLTKAGTTMGTPMYMSLEQLNGAKSVDARSDVYSFGVVLYEALTGRTPYEAETFPELAIKIAMVEPVRPRLLRPDIPVALEQIMARAMAKDRDARTESMEALIAQLAPYAHVQVYGGAQLAPVAPQDSAMPMLPGVAASRPVQTRVPSKRSTWWLAGAGVLLALGGAAVQHERAPKLEVPPLPARYARETPTQVAPVSPRDEPPIGAPDAAVAPLAPAPVVEQPAEALTARRSRRTSRTRDDHARAASKPEAVSLPVAQPLPNAQPQVAGRRYRATPQAPKSDEF